MQSSNGKFCNTYKATHVDNINLDPSIWIELREPPLDTLVGQKVEFSNNGNAHVFCWSGFLPNHTYFFNYTKRNNGKEVDGSGDVTN